MRDSEAAFADTRATPGGRGVRGSTPVGRRGEPDGRGPRRGRSSERGEASVDRPPNASAAAGGSPLGETSPP
ncbi:hypothetical protein AB7C87_21950 [Natrarchaeobius sp. A-rgal3]|uniref:hypothetical protein n=1 Tax=Natrarchaeobius versutus TaxID=1679078 RepID=UPI00350EE6E4